MKRTFKFLLGLAVGFSLAYGLRRLLIGESQPTAPEVAPKDVPSTSESPAKESFVIPGNNHIIQSDFTDSSAAADVVSKNVEHFSSEDNDLQAPAIVETSDQNRSAEEVSTENTEPTATVPVPTAKNFDFLIINDIGPISNKRLLEAGLSSFAELAELPVEEIARITKLPAARIIQNLWREQSAHLAKGLLLEDFEASFEASNEGKTE